MNIKANGELLKSPLVHWLSVPASGGDESLSLGACFHTSINKKIKTSSMKTPFLGNESILDESWNSRLKETKMNKSDFLFIHNFNHKKVAKLLFADEILARCVGKSEFGAELWGTGL